jgi:sterol 3beta-glucosyltransferase
MKVALISFGSRGDLEPMAALGAELIQRGYEALLITNEDIQDLSPEPAVPVRTVSIHVKDMLHQEGTALLQARSAVKSLKILSGIIVNNLGAIALEVFELAKDCDLLIINERYYLIAQNIHDHSQAPIVQICFQPKGVTRRYPYLYFRPWYFRFFPNRATHHFVDSMLLGKFLPAVNAVRKQYLALPALRLKALLRQKQAGLMLQGFSPSLFKRPDDWNPNLVVCGNWSGYKTPSESLPADLSSFLSTPKRRLYVGFGSMLYAEERFLDLLQTLVERLDIHIVWVQNWNDRSRLTPGLYQKNIYILQDCDHRLLFPHVDMVLHHGGSGTVNTAARFWATQVEHLRLGVNLGTFHQLNAEILLQAIATLQQDTAIRQQCDQIRQQMRQENGVKYAIDYLESSGYLKQA